MGGSESGGYRDTPQNYHWAWGTWFFLAQNAGVHYSQIKLYEKPIVAQGKLSTQGGFSISVFVYWRIAQGPGRFLGFTKKTQMEQLRWFNTRSGPPVMFVGLWTNDALVISP
jgi:hypothetical protein